MKQVFVFKAGIAEQLGFNAGELIEMERHYMMQRAEWSCSPEVINAVVEQIFSAQRYSRRKHGICVPVIRNVPALSATTRQRALRTVILSPRHVAPALHDALDYIIDEFEDGVHGPCPEGDYADYPWQSVIEPSDYMKRILRPWLTTAPKNPRHAERLASHVRHEERYERVNGRSPYEERRPHENQARITDIKGQPAVEARRFALDWVSAAQEAELPDCVAQILSALDDL